MKFIDKDLQSMQEARILMEEARDAHHALRFMDQAALDHIVVGLIDKIRPDLAELCQLSFDETGYGDCEEEFELTHQLINLFLSGLEDEPAIGVLERNADHQMTKVGYALGVVTVVSSPFNPVATTLYLALLAIRNGNCIVFSPHQKAQKTIQATVSKLRQYIEYFAVPSGVVATLEHVTDEGTCEIIASPYHAKTLDFQNGPWLQKKSPVFIEKTADIAQSVAKIISGRAFTNGLLPASEQYLIVEADIQAPVKAELAQAHAHFLTGDEADKLIQFILTAKGEVQPHVIGKSAQWLAQKSGFTVSDRTKILVSEQAYISVKHPLVTSLPLPILLFYVEADWIRACEKCLELLLSDASPHVLSIYSNNEQIIEQFILKKPVQQVNVNHSVSAENCFNFLKQEALTCVRTIAYSQTKSNIKETDDTFDILKHWEFE
jgi:acyl-CoA reductase-like NAD-dependent aldehyde dehydrogenase